MAATPAPPPPLHRLVTPDDHGPSITVAAALCMSVMLLFFLTRLYIRYPLASLFSYDDVVVSVASAVATVQATLILVAVRNGLGRKAHLLSPGEETHVLKMLYAGSLFYMIAITIAKVSMACLLHRLSGSKSQKFATKILGAAIVLWGVASLFAVALRQDVSAPWNSQTTLAHSTVTRWIAVEALGLVFEVLILGFVGALVWNLHASAQTKGSVLSGFLSRLGLFAIVPVRLYYSHRDFLRHDTTPTFAAALPEILIQLEMHYTIISATLPCLRIFLRSFQSGYLGGIGLDAPDDYHSRSGTHMATAGSGTRPGPSGNDSTMQSLHVNVTTSVELKTLDVGRSAGRSGGRDSPIELNDAASDGSANPLYDSKARVDAYCYNRRD